MVNFAMGVGIINFVRLSSAHIGLGIAGIVIGSLSLFLIAPADRTYSGLWHSGGASLAIGGLLSFWDLYRLLTWQHIAGTVAFTIFVLWIIGAGSNK